METKKVVSIWAGNLEFALIAGVKAFFSACEPGSVFRTHNADAYSGPGDMGNPDIAFIQPGYDRILADHISRGIETYIESGSGLIVSAQAQLTESEESHDQGTGDRCSEINESGSDVGADYQGEGIKDPDLVSLPAAEPYQVADRLENDDHVPGPRRRGRPRRKTQGGPEK